jgi:nucleoside-triphosphatase THEP1
MNIAYTMAPGRGDTDLLLSRLAATLASQGVRSCGTVQINTDRASGPCAMDVRVLPDGPVLRISQDLGSASKGCRLDPAALETAVGLVEARLGPDVDLLIINKFGKHEAEGRGFRTTIARALDLQIPVLVGVNSLNVSAFMEFAGSEAVRLAPSDDPIYDWLAMAIDLPPSIHPAAPEARSGLRRSAQVGQSSDARSHHVA